MAFFQGILGQRLNRSPSASWSFIGFIMVAVVHVLFLARRLELAQSGGYGLVPGRIVAAAIRDHRTRTELAC